MIRTFLNELSTVSLSLSSGGLKLFSSPIQWVCLANGDADFQDNVIFFGFTDKQTDPVLVAKVPRLLKNGWMLKTEYDHLVELWDCIGEKAERFVPKPYTLASLQERPVLLLSYVSGESLTRLARKSFWDEDALVLSLAKEAAQTLRDLNHLTERPLAGEAHHDTDFSSKAEKFREDFKLTAEEDRVLSDLVRTVNEKAKTASHKILLQGDFWHGNMIRNKQPGRLMLVDWQFARWSVDASLDVYFFLLAGALAATGTGPVDARAKLAQELLRHWRIDVIPAYLNAYGKPQKYAILPQKEGMLLCCVEKAVRSALEFGYSHPDDLLWRCLFSELQNWPVEA